MDNETKKKKEKNFEYDKWNETEQWKHPVTISVSDKFDKLIYPSKTQGGNEYSITSFSQSHFCNYAFHSFSTNLQVL